MEELIGDVLPPLQDFEDSLANGVYLCKLGMRLLPDEQHWKKVLVNEIIIFLCCNNIRVYFFLLMSPF